MVPPSQPSWPDWWQWDIELTPHLLKRMVEREFNELDLRTMLQYATGLREDAMPGRWVIVARHRRRTWEIIVEPDEVEQVVVVVTAYPVDR